MADYNLLQNEAVIIRNDNVYHPIGKKLGELGELVLTNMNLIYVRKGIFGGTKETLKFPLNQIKKFDDKPQITLGKSENGYHQLEIYFLNSQEYFVFNTFGKKEALKWLDKIWELLTGHAAELDESERSYIPGIATVADTIKNTVGSFAGALGIKPDGNKKENVTIRCISCRATLSGTKGQIVKCKYCDTEQTLK